MLLSEVKNVLSQVSQIAFRLPDGSLVPRHFHVTEIGKINKHFIDCGGTIRKEFKVSFQLWDADDYDHRLHPEKLIKIIELSQEKLGIGDHEVEVEYQGLTIEKYGLEFDGSQFLLVSKATDCLAREKCGVSLPIIEVASTESCSPGGGCC